MDEQEALLNKIRAYDRNVDSQQIIKACAFSEKAHGLQKRASGEPYYLHPLAVAHILADMKLDQASIITALLHDTVEDTHVCLSDIKREFSEEVCNLVDGVTKLAKIAYQSENVRQAENFRKLLLAVSDDIRVLVVKLADRLHNMRTLHFVKSPEKRLRIAHETMDIYAPLAERIGMQQLKNELHDLAFSYLHVEIRESILGRLDYLRNKGNIAVENVLQEIHTILVEEGIEKEVEVHGREKTPFSIWRKMERKNISFEQLSDVMAFRIITRDVAMCYRVLGIIHSKYQMVPDSFKDFISTPKDNGYQSLHTVVLGPEQHFIEIQIRSRHMHEIAEFGVAAHWSYKQQQDYSTEGRQYKWIRELLYILEHASDSEDFLESTKLEMHYDQVFCFTPRGELIALPRGATPVDFAYAVHSSVGNHCSAVKVNGRIVPLSFSLTNGDQVEIVTSKTQNISADWLRFVVTGKAKSEIRRYIRMRKRGEYIKLGRSLMIKMFREERVKFSKKNLSPAIPRLGKKSMEDIYVALGEGSLTVKEVLRAVFPERKLKKKRKNPFSFLMFHRDRKKPYHRLPIKGLLPGLAVYFAECCHPIPGDRIVGVVTTGKGMTIHTGDCAVLENFAMVPERLVDVEWDKVDNLQDYIGRIKVTLAHESGSLAALTNVIAQSKGNISNLKVTGRYPDFFEMVIDVTVRGETQLANIIASLNNHPLIHSVERYKK